MRDLLESVNKSFPAVPSSLLAARRVVVDLAVAAGATAEQIDAIRLATSEAVTNVIVHAYRDRPGQIHLTAAMAHCELFVLVADDGDGLNQRSGKTGLGLGLTLIAQACDELMIVKRSGGGTELRMRFPVGGSSDRVDAHVQGSVSSASSRDASDRDDAHVRGSVSSARSPASSSFSTTR